MAYTYYAFISYSRRDKAAARYLQNKLESYRYPAVLVAPDHKPENPKYLRKIFRDTSDLDVTQSNFTESIDRHIAESRYLVVLCSPNSAKSVWVDREIVRFLETHDNNPQLIFPIILEGDVPDCLPEKLRTPEFFNRNIPTMIPDDASSRKEGWEHGFLQLVGCMLNVSIAKITDRFQKAKQAALRRIVFGTLAALAVTVGLTVWALIAEHKARQAEREARTAEHKARIAEKKAVAAEKVARHEAEIANATLGFIKGSFAAADANRSGNKDMTLLEFAKTSAGGLDKIPLPEVRLRVAAITLPLVSGMGDPKTALKYFTPLLPEAKKVFPAKSTQMTEFNIAYADLLFGNGKYADALVLYDRSRREMEHDCNSVTYAKIVYNMAWCYYRQGENDNAIQAAKQNALIRKQLFGPDDIGIANSFSVIGAVYYRKCEYDKAIEYHQKALEIYRKKLRSDHPNTATALNNIGNVYYCKGEYDKAIEYYQKSLAIKRKKLGEDHPAVASSLCNIGDIYNSKGKYGKAIEYYKMAWNIRSKKLAGDHPLVASTQNKILCAYCSNGEHDKAIEELEKMLALYIKKFGIDNQNTAFTLHNLGFVYSQKGEYDKAIEYYRKALAIKGYQSNQQVHLTLDGIGNAYYRKGEYGKAIEHYEQALAIRRKKIGLDHPRVAQSLINIGGVYSKKGEYDKAIEYFQKSLAIRRKKLGDDHQDTAESHHYLGLAYLELYRKNRAPADLQAAEKDLTLARNVRMKKFGPDNSKTRETFRALEELERLRTSGK